ncbi:unnamed protein product, partial [Ectocarpus sp. 13 AM-2016]
PPPPACTKPHFLCCCVSPSSPLALIFEGTHRRRGEQETSKGKEEPLPFGVTADWKSCITAVPSRKQLAHRLTDRITLLPFTYEARNSRRSLAVLYLCIQQHESGFVGLVC